MAWYGYIVVQLHGRPPIEVGTRYGVVNGRPEALKSRVQYGVNGKKVVLTKKENSHFPTLVKKLIKHPTRACMNGPPEY